MSDEQRAVIHDLDTTCQRHGVVLLWVSNTRWKKKKQRQHNRGDYDAVAARLEFHEDLFGLDRRPMTVTLHRVKQLPETNGGTHVDRD